jgi:hypothetical protein
MIEVALFSPCQQAVQYDGQALGEHCHILYQIDPEQQKIIVLSTANRNALTLHRSCLQEWLIRHLVQQNQIQVNHKGLFNLATTFVASNIKLNVEKRNPTMKELASVLDQLVTWVETEDHQQASLASFSTASSKPFDLSTLPAFFHTEPIMA